MRLITIVIVLFSFNTLVAQDLKLWYKQSAQKWTDAIPLGNGKLAAMVFGGVEQDRIQFNEETLWTGEPRTHARPGAWKYLASIRKLIAEGRQQEAEALAGREFMGLKSSEGKREEWVRKITAGITGSSFIGENTDDLFTKEMTVPSYDGWEVKGFEGLDGAVWLRKTIELTNDFTGGDLILDLNRIRDSGIVFFNGKLVTKKKGEGARYLVDKALVKAGRNNLVVLVLNFNDKGGITGYKDTSRHIGLFPDGDESRKISLNGRWQYRIADDNPPPVSVYQASYQPFGDLYFDFHHSGPATAYRRELDLSTAVSSTSYKVGEVDFRREYFTSYPDQMLVVHFTASKPGMVNFDLSITSPHKGYVLKRNDKGFVLSVKVRNGALRGEAWLVWSILNGTVDDKNGKLIVRNADEATCYLAAATNFVNYRNVSGNPAEHCRKIIAKAGISSFNLTKQKHIKDYQEFFNRYSISFTTAGSKNILDDLPTDERLANFATSDDPGFVALYQQYGRYLLISSSRPGSQPANLQGKWNDMLNPPWGSKYTTNINLEMNYWPADLLNLSAMIEPLFSMINDLSIAGRETAKEHYNAPGWVLHHNTDLWRGTSPINAPDHGIWVTGGAWLCQHLWEHYLFTGDKQFLANTAYPKMKSAASFFKSYLVPDSASGYYISTPSNSPEQGGLVQGPAMDHQLIRALFNNVKAATDILNKDKNFGDDLHARALRIFPDRIGKYGQLQEWMYDVDDTANKHRHISHLWAMYPGSEINWETTPDLMRAARQSLLYRGDAATGWSLGWKINCWARFKDGEHTYRLLQMLLSPVKGGAGSYTNLFDAHPPFQIDGNFGAAAGIGEMLVQSHAGYIDILPALPNALRNGGVSGLCTRGAFEISMSWSEGKLNKLDIFSRMGQPLRLRYNEKVIDITTRKGMHYSFDANLNQIK